MSETQDKIECRTPTSGRDGVTRIPAWKYKKVRDAIVKSFAQSSEPHITFTDLRTLAKTHLSEVDTNKIGSWGWHFTTVKLNMEVLGELMRDADATPQRLTLTL